MEEIKKVANEDIPKEYKEFQRKRLIRQVRDENWNPVKDDKGNYVYKLDVKDFNNRLKDLASTFARQGVDINQINFDDYKLDPGIHLDKIPKGTIAMLKYGDHFYVIDKRTTGRGPGVDHWFNNRVMRSRDGKYVDANRIPDKQFLEGAEIIWIIPEEIFTRDTMKIRNERYNLSKNNKYPRRYKNWEEYAGRYSQPNENRYIDKSGFLIDRRAIKEKYDKMAKEIEFKKMEDNLDKKSQEVIDRVSAEFNKKVEEVFDLAHKYFKIDHTLGEFDNFSNEIRSAARNLADIIKSITSNLRYLQKEDHNPDDAKWIKEDIYDRIKSLENFFTNGSGSWFERTYKGLKRKEPELLAMDNQSPTTLQATESYFISGKFLSAFESQTRPMPKRKK